VCVQHWKQNRHPDPNKTLLTFLKISLEIIWVSNNSWCLNSGHGNPHWSSISILPTLTSNLTPSSFSNSQIRAFASSSSRKVHYTHPSRQSYEISHVLQFQYTHSHRVHNSWNSIRTHPILKEQRGHWKPQRWSFYLPRTQAPPTLRTILQTHLQK